MTDIQLPEDLRKLDVALRRLRDQKDILNTFEAWYFLFEHYYDENIRDLESESVAQCLQSGAATCVEGFVEYFVSVPHVRQHCMCCCAAQISNGQSVMP